MTASPMVLHVEFVLEIPMNAGPDDVWRALVAWDQHGTWIPLTRSRILHGDGGVGTTFVARTGIGAFGFDDNMTVTELVGGGGGGGTGAVSKTGPWLLGSASFSVKPAQPGSVVIWTESVDMPVPALVTPVAKLIRRPVEALTTWGAKAGFRIALARLDRQLK